MFWIGILYFAEGFPLGVFYDVFPVHFRQQGVDLREIGFMSLLGLAWTLKFLWAPAVDHFRHHRRWMFSVDVLMGGIMLLFAIHADFGPWVWISIGAFTALSATNDIAIDGFTIEMLNKHELGLANGLRIAFYRVGMLASGFILILTDVFGWAGTYTAGAAIFVFAGLACLNAPKERDIKPAGSISLTHELKALLTHPAAFSVIVAFLLGSLWLVNNTTQWSVNIEYFWRYALLVALLLILFSSSITRFASGTREAEKRTPLTEGPMFGTLLEMLQRPYIVPIILFILIFKLGDSAMGFMIKPFWVDSGFSATQIGLVSVNIGLGFSIAGGIAGGWFTDRIGHLQGALDTGPAAGSFQPGLCLGCLRHTRRCSRNTCCCQPPNADVLRQRHRIFLRRTGYGRLSCLPDVHRQQAPLGHRVCPAVIRVCAQPFRFGLGRRLWCRRLRLCRLLPADFLSCLPGLFTASLGKKDDGLCRTARGLGTKLDSPDDTFNIL